MASKTPGLGTAAGSPGISVTGSRPMKQIRFDATSKRHDSRLLQSLVSYAMAGISVM